MDKDTFITIPPSTRVQKVNKLLQKHSLAEISERLGIPVGSFSKLFRKSFLMNRNRQQPQGLVAFLK